MDSNNVLASHGSELRPRFLSPDDRETGTETFRTTDQEPLPVGPLLDLSTRVTETSRHRRISTPKALPSVPRRAPIVPKASQTSLRHAQVIQGRLVLEPNPPTSEVITGTPVAPRSPTSTVRSIEWGNISETMDHSHAYLQNEL